MPNKNYLIGYRFQRRAKDFLEKNGYRCVIQPRSKFPDIVAWSQDIYEKQLFKVLLVECKVNKYLSKEEKLKAKKLIKDGTCSKFLVAYRDGRKLRFTEIE